MFIIDIITEYIFQKRFPLSNRFIWTLFLSKAKKPFLNCKKVVLQTQRNPSLYSVFKQTDELERWWRVGTKKRDRTEQYKASSARLLRTKLVVNWEDWRHSGQPRQWTVLLSLWTLWSTITEYYANTYPLDENFPFRQIRFLIFFFSFSTKKMRGFMRRFIVSAFLLRWWRKTGNQI